MKVLDIEIIDGKFKYLDCEYDCKYLIERDKKNILREADESHKNTFDKLYVRDSLTPLKCIARIDDNCEILYIMIVYTIDYKEKTCKRLACGDYYPDYQFSNNSLYYHPYQGSICW